MRNFAIILVLLAHSLLSQPMDWSHHYLIGGYNDPFNNIEVDKYGNIVGVGNFFAHSPFIIFPKTDIDKCATFLTEGPKNYFYDILSRKNGEVWAFYSDSIYIYENGNYSEPVRKIRSTLPSGIEAIIETSDGRLITGTTNKKLFSYENNQWKSFPWPAGLNDQLVPSLYDSKGNLWARTLQSGIYCYTQGQWIHFDTSNSNLKSNKISRGRNSILEGKDGKIYAGTDDEENNLSGLYIYSGTEWKRKEISSNPQFNSIMCMALDSSGALWLGTNSSVARVKNDSVFTYTDNHIRNFDSPDGYVRNIIVDDSNRVFFAMFHTGIYMLKQNSYSTCGTMNNLRLTSPQSLTQCHISDTLYINWKSFGCIDSVLLQYRLADTPWKPIDTQKSNNAIFNSSHYKWILPALQPGTYYIRISDINDSTTGDISNSFQVVSTTQNIPPELMDVPDSIQANVNQTNSWTAHATDAESEVLTYQFSNLPQWITAQDNVISIKPDNASTPVSIKIKVTDGNGGADSASVRIIPVPAVVSLFHGHVNKTPVTFTTKKNMLAVSVNKQSTAIVKSASLYDCTGRRIAELNKNESGFYLNDARGLYGKGIYYCIVYTTGNSPLIIKKITMIE